MCLIKQLYIQVCSPSTDATDGCPYSQCNQCVEDGLRVVQYIVLVFNPSSNSSLQKKQNEEQIVTKC